MGLQLFQPVQRSRAEQRVRRHSRGKRPQPRDCHWRANRRSRLEFILLTQPSSIQELRNLRWPLHRSRLAGPRAFLHPTLFALAATYWELACLGPDQAARIARYKSGGYTGEGMIYWSPNHALRRTRLVSGGLN